MKKKTKIIAMPCLCVDIFDGTDEIRPGGEALNFAAHASEFDHIDIALISVIGNDTYGKTKIS
jgi:fructoselysine 6-kinase